MQKRDQFFNEDSTCNVQTFGICQICKRISYICTCDIALHSIDNQSRIFVAEKTVQEYNYLGKLRNVIYKFIGTIYTCFIKFLKFDKSRPYYPTALECKVWSNIYSSNTVPHNNFYLNLLPLKKLCILHFVTAMEPQEHDDNKVTIDYSVCMVSAKTALEPESTNKECVAISNYPSITEKSSKSNTFPHSASPSISSLKSRKSSGILAQFINRTRRKKGDISESILHLDKTKSDCKSTASGSRTSSCASISVRESIQEKIRRLERNSSKSKIPVLKSKSLITKDVANEEIMANSAAVVNNQSENNGDTTEKEYSAEISKKPSVHSTKDTDCQVPKPPKNQSFLRKLLTKQSNRSENKTVCNPSKNKSSVAANTENANDSFEDEVCLAEVSINEESCAKIDRQQSDKNEMAASCSSEECIRSKIASTHIEPMPSKYLNFESPFLEISLADGLHQALEMSTQLKYDETHLVELITKYIQDNSLQKDLINAIYQHSKMHVDTERRVQSLANDMWLQQAEINRNQEKALQDTLNSVIKQNRQLQQDYEALLRRNEKLQAKLGSLSYLSPRASFGGGHLVDSLTKSNEKLQVKIVSLFRQIENLEDQLDKQQKNNKILEERIRNSSSQIQNYKSILQRTNTDREVEIAMLNRQLLTNEVIIKEGVEAGDVLLDDLDAFKRQAKSIPCALNWNKFKCRGNSLTDLIHMGRSCINELIRELTATQNKLSLVEKDNEGLQTVNKKLQENLQKCSTELNNTAKVIEIYRNKEGQWSMEKEKKEEIQREAEELRNKLLKSAEVIEEKDKALLESNKSSESSKNVIAMKDNQIQELQRLVADGKLENNALKNQINGMQEVLSSSGAGDMAKQLVETQQKVSYFEEKYYQLLYEKSYLIEQVNSFSMEKNSLVEYQQAYYEHLQHQQKDLELLNAENFGLKEQLSSFHATIQALQNERVRHLEEKNILRTIYHQLKNEISRTEHLENTVADMNKEASRLAVIAEYNKQLGDKLKCEVEERDETINKLQKSVEAINSAHIENTKDKLALCMELKEVCSIKEQLNNNLDAEVQKSSSLGQSKKELENATNSKLKAIEEMQKIERKAMAELLEEYKITVAQRDQLLVKQNQYDEELSDMKENLMVQIHSSKITAAKCEETEKQIKELEQHLRAKETYVENLKIVLLAKENNIADLNNTIDQLKREKENLENSVMYLQNNIQKLNTDLNESWKSDAENKLLLQQQNAENSNIQTLLKTQKETIQKMENEKSSLETEVENLANVCRKLVSDYEANVATTINVESDMRQDLEDSKAVVTKSSEEIQRLLQITIEKEKEVNRLKEKCDMLRKRVKALEKAAKEAELQNKLLNESTTEIKKLQQQLQDLQKKYDASFSESAAHADELELTKKNLADAIKQRNDDHLSYKRRVEELVEEYNNEKSLIKEDLYNFKQKFEDLEKSMETERGGHANLATAHKELASKLLKAIRLVIDEKVARQKANSISYNLSQEISVLKTEKETLMIQITELSTENEKLDTENKKLTCDNESLKQLLQNSQVVQDDLQKKQDLLEQALKATKKKYKEVLQHKLITDKKNSEFKLTESKFNDEVEETKRLKAELEQKQDCVLQFKQEITLLKKEITALEFQKCELSLHLYEIQGRLSTEHNLNQCLHLAQQRFLTAILQMKNEGAISEMNYEVLFCLVCNRDDSCSSG